MNITVTLFNSLGCQLDSQTITLRGEDITLRKIADSLGDWPLADGDKLVIEAPET